MRLISSHPCAGLDISTGSAAGAGNESALWKHRRALPQCRAQRHSPAAPHHSTSQVHIGGAVSHQSALSGEKDPVAEVTTHLSHRYRVEEPWEHLLHERCHSGVAAHW